MSVIKSKLTLFDMQIECTFMNTTKLRQSCFCDCPEVFNSINMVRTMRKLIIAMLDSMVLFIAKIHQAVIRFKPVRVHDGIFFDFVSDDGQKLCGRTVSDNLCVHLAALFNQTEDDMFPTCATTANASDPTSTEVTFIDFNLTRFKRTLGFTEHCNSLTNSLENSVDRRTADTCQGGDFRRFNIKGKIPYYLPEFLLRNFGMKYIFVSHSSIIT